MVNTARKTNKLQSLASRWDKADKWVKRVIGAVTTLGVIAGMVTGMSGWVIGQLDAHFDNKFDTITTQIEVLDAKSDAADRKLELSNTRTELMMLISHNPENVVQIEMVARYYFLDLGGDWYMSSIYSQWAREYGGDLSFVAHID